VKLLLATDSIDPDPKDLIHSQTPLTWAAGSGHETVVKLLLAKDGVGFNSKDIYGRTPLWWAAKFGREGVAKLLLAVDGVDADCKDNNGQTPLWCAAENGHKETVLVLLENKVDVDAEDNSGYTALHIATVKANREVEQLLIEEGATEPHDFYGLQALFRETVLGKDHPDMLASMGNLATSLRHQGKYAESQAVHQRTDLKSHSQHPLCGNSREKQNEGIT
jgi:hypothetical protein